MKISTQNKDKTKTTQKTAQNRKNHQEEVIARHDPKRAGGILHQKPTVVVACYNFEHFAGKD